MKEEDIPFSKVTLVKDNEKLRAILEKERAECKDFLAWLNLILPHLIVAPGHGMTAGKFIVRCNAFPDVKQRVVEGDCVLNTLLFWYQESTGKRTSLRV